MELAGSGYLYALATISVTFVGFSALLLVFRQTMGGDMTRYDRYFILAFMQVGFIVTGGSLVPSLLALYGIPEAMVWRVSSVIAAVPIVLFVATVPHRRRASAGGSTPFFVRFLLLVQLLLAVYLLVNASSIWFAPGAAHFAAAMAGMLFTSGIAYLLALGIALHQPLPPP